MATEPDQTRWVGIRPTPDCNDIPTISKKQAPAIGDLQAIKDRYYYLRSNNNKDCSVEYNYGLPACPANEIWVITHISIVNYTSLCDMKVEAVYEGVGRPLKVFYSIEPNLIQAWDGWVVLANGNAVWGRWELGGVTDDLRLWAHGYKIGVY